MDLCWQSGNFLNTPRPAQLSKEQGSFNCMAEVTVCSDPGAQENKICHYFHFFPFYFPWSNGTGCRILFFKSWALHQLFHSPLTPSRGSWVPNFLPLEWYHRCVWGNWNGFGHCFLCICPQFFRHSCLPDLIPSIYLSPQLYYRKGFDLGHTWMAYVFFPTFFNSSLNFAKDLMIWASQLQVFLLVV